MTTIASIRCVSDEDLAAVAGCRMNDGKQQLTYPDQRGVPGSNPDSPNMEGMKILDAFGAGLGIGIIIGVSL